MNPQVLDSLAFICPACRSPTNASPLRLGTCLKEEGGYLIEGFLDCTNLACLHRYPVIAGVPIILKDMEAWWRSVGLEATQNLAASHEILAYFAATGVKEQEGLLSTYLQSHFQTADTYWKTLAECLAAVAPSGLALDMGCATGGHTFELARHSRWALGMDLNFSLVSAAARIQREQSIHFSRQRRCCRAEAAEYRFDLPKNVLFMVADALEPPFTAGIFDFVSALNLLDNVRFPLILIGQMDALLKTAGSLLLTSPFAWNSELCEPAEWLENEAVSGPEFLKSILAGQRFAQMALDYRICREIDHVDWVLPQHDRLKSVYSVYVLLAQKG